MGGVKHGGAARHSIRIRREGLPAPHATAGPLRYPLPMIDISVVIPARDERESLSALLPELRAVMDRLGKAYEVIVVDDGSRDGTFDLLDSHTDGWPELVGIRLRTSTGQTGALRAGFDHSRGKTVVTLDGDGQNDPADIPKLLDKLGEGFDLVSGRREERKDPAFSKRLPSAVANRLVRLCSGSTLTDQGCALKAYRAEILKELRIHGEQHRFIGALAEGLGASVTEVPVHHRARGSGRSHYGWGRVPKVLLDLLFLRYILSYANRPLHLFGGVGLLSFGVGFATCGWVSFEKLVFKQPAADRPLLLLGVLLVLMGVILVTLGIVAELLVRGQHELSGTPSYRVERVVGNPQRESR